MKLTASRHAFATLIAVTLIAFVGTALVSLSYLFALEARRTRDGVWQAQLRQLLEAGAVVAQSKAARWGEEAPPLTMDLPLPAVLTEQDAAAHLALVPDAPSGTAICRITARVGGHQGGQRLTFTRGEGGWSVTRVERE